VSSLFYRCLYLFEYADGRLLRQHIHITHREQTGILSDPVDFPKRYRFLCTITAYQEAMRHEMLDPLVPGFVVLD
jgi:hypothetical protein